MADEVRKKLKRMGYIGTPGELIRARWLNNDEFYGLHVTIGIIDIDQAGYVLDDNHPVTYFLKFSELTVYALVRESISLHRTTQSEMLGHLRELVAHEGLTFKRTSLVLEKHAWNEIRKMSQEMRLQPIAAKLRLL